jgi:NTP pyrophosphatase (non-canonical NTP hydrolase)
MVFGDAFNYHEEQSAIIRETIRQHEKFGTQSLTLFDWSSILGEEYGEVCRAINEEHFSDGELQSVYDECIQVAAVAVHMAAVIREASCK